MAKGIHTGNSGILEELAFKLQVNLEETSETIVLARSSQRLHVHVCAAPKWTCMLAYTDGVPPTTDQTNIAVNDRRHCAKS